jgi:membrane protein implicated in regulation of membrane protease activity
MDAWFWVWLVLAAVLSIAEIFHAGFFLLPFGIGAALAAVMNVLKVSLGWQWVGFIVGSAAALFALRRFAERITHEPPQATGGNRLIGKCGVVIETLELGAGQGRVRVEREEWRADAPGYEPLSVGTSVTVVRIEGTHLIVKPTEKTCED